MKSTTIPPVNDNKYYHLDDEDNESPDSEPRKLTEYEKEAYAKDFLRELFKYKRYCPTDKTAQAIGGAFAREDVLAICNEPEHPIKTLTMRGKKYIEIHPFMQKLVNGMELSFSQ